RNSACSISDDCPPDARSDVHPVHPWFLNQIPLIPIGTAIEGLFCHSIHRAFLEAYGTVAAGLNSRISNPVRSKPPGQYRATLAGTRCSCATSRNQRSHWLELQSRTFVAAAGSGLYW